MLFESTTGRSAAAGSTNLTSRDDRDVVDLLGAPAISPAAAGTEARRIGEASRPVRPPRRAPDHLQRCFARAESSAHSIAYAAGNGCDAFDRRQSSSLSSFFRKAAPRCTAATPTPRSRRCGSNWTPHCQRSLGAMQRQAAHSPRNWTAARYHADSTLGGRFIEPNGRRERTALPSTDALVSSQVLSREYPRIRG